MAQDEDRKPPNFDHLFTSERLASIDAAAADIKAGNYLTTEQVREHFEKKRAAMETEKRSALSAVYHSEGSKGTHAVL